MNYQEIAIKNIINYNEDNDGNFNDFIVRELRSIFNIIAEKEEIPFPAKKSKITKRCYLSNIEMNLTLDVIDHLIYEAKELTGQVKDSEKILTTLNKLSVDRKWDILEFQKGLVEVIGHNNLTDIAYNITFLTKKTMEGKDYN